MLAHELFTSGIGYLRVMFRTDHVPSRDLPYVGLLKAVLGFVDTTKHTYSDLSDEINLNTGGITISVSSYAAVSYTHLGMAFPSDDMLGIDLVIPDVSYLKNNIDKVKGFVITHGHEDHIGALPYVLRDVPAPVYGTKLTIGLIENKLKEHNMMKTVRRKVVKHGQSINLGCFRKMCIRDSCYTMYGASVVKISSIWFSEWMFKSIGLDRSRLKIPMMDLASIT